MTAPVRLQLSRRKGFYLQALSLRTNGLPAKAVTRASRWGNPFRVGDCADVFADIANDHSFSIDRYLESTVLPRVESRFMGLAPVHAANLFNRWVLRMYCADKAAVREWLAPLRGHNLACFCQTGGSCHADTLLEYAELLFREGSE